MGETVNQFQLFGKQTYFATYCIVNLWQKVYLIMLGCAAWSFVFSNIPIVEATKTFFFLLVVLIINNAKGKYKN